MATRPLLNRARAIREMCFECRGYELRAINTCDLVDCPLWGWRRGPGGPDLSGEWQRRNRVKAIRDFCRECMGGQRYLINECNDRPCALWGWRRGAGQPEWTTSALRRQTPHVGSSNTFRRVSGRKLVPNRAITER